MTNPWNTIPLSIYEEHMRQESVGQLQALSDMMKDQFSTFPAASIMILGVAGGNGLIHIDPSAWERVYGIDINPAYLKECEQRYPQLKNVLECQCANLSDKACVLPHAEVVIANLLIEYIGYACFQDTIQKISPTIVSCIIQVNEQDSFVSDSPYLHSFDCLDEVHVQMEEEALTACMKQLRYSLIQKSERSLPNQKKLIQLDYQKA